MGSIFSAFPPSEWVHSNALAFVIRDRFPVSPGHTLIIPKREIAEWWEATREEQLAILELMEVAKRELDASNPKPDGYNIGINCGAAAGQTVMHLHVHLIPRYRDDVEDPRGGIRHVIPNKGNYLLRGSEGSVPLQTRLTTGERRPLLPLLEHDLGRSSAVDIAVAFVMRSGVDRLEPALSDLLRRGGRLRLITGDYLDITDPDALQRLLDLGAAHPAGDLDLRVFVSAGTSFHPKSYILRYEESGGAAYVGSSNLSKSALEDGVEWNYRIIPSADRDGFAEVSAAFEALFKGPQTQAVSPEWVDGYRSRRRKHVQLAAVDAEAEAIETPPEPHPIQREALAALEATRLDGNAAGLVVLATGLGKTWLSAFDSNRPEVRRILFVAHREEILAQAMKTFRRVRPKARLGLYTGDEKSIEADVLFASIQTLGRQAHLAQFARETFDYVVVDEFHHASASTYRRLLQHFTPKFLLGLTATPERTDGGDLLQLCGENLVYRCDLTRGIEERLLSPFHYFGVPDEVDYAQIPWRSTRFDEEALTRAVETQSRAENAFEQWEKHGGRTSRTLAFCVSRTHARFMARFFAERGVSCATVHSGPDSDPRASSIELLRKGELKVVFAVDMFNEGVDVPALDMVLMLRPTESAILWLQQFGRGLRLDESNSDKVLTVVDYIGNHRVFLTKVRSLLQVGSRSDSNLRSAFDAVLSGDHKLPPGCEVTYELEAIDLIRGLLRVREGSDAVKSFYEDFKLRMGRRPTATEAFHEHISLASVRATHGGWFGLVRGMGDLSSQARSAFETHGAMLEDLEKTPMVKSFKMLVLSALLGAGRFPGEMDIDALASEFRRIALGSRVYREDVGEERLQNAKQLRRLLEDHPIHAWVEGRGTGNARYFEYRDGVLRTRFKLPSEQIESLRELVGELVDLRLAEYQERVRRQRAAGFEAKVTHNRSGSPILILPDRAKVPSIPEGVQTVLVEGRKYEGNFAKIALNVLRNPEGGSNELPKILRGWFGPNVGKSGTNYLVACEPGPEWVVLRPARVPNVIKGPELWKRYSREQIPPLFGEVFSEAIWNSGFVATQKNLFLLVTLEKGDLHEDFQYADRFLSPRSFNWQSQNRTSQRSKHGQLIRDHVAAGVGVQLFVRNAKKVKGNASPFVYCGPVTFESWSGEKPISVRWRLSEPVPERLRGELNAS